MDLAVGCSAGGLYASALALGWELEATERRSHEMWQGLFARIDYLAIIRGLFPRLFPGRKPAGLLDEPEEPLQAMLADPWWRLLPPAGEQVEGCANALESCCDGAIPSSTQIPACLLPSFELG